MPSSKLSHPNKSHPGKAGRKPALSPMFLKKFRATDTERSKFRYWTTGDAREDFVLVMEALNLLVYWKIVAEREPALIELVKKEMKRYG